MRGPLLGLTFVTFTAVAKKQISELSLRSSNTIRARRAVEEGQYHKAIQFLSSDGVAPANVEVFSEMLLKHPQASPPQSSLPVPDSAVIDESCTVKCLNSFLARVPLLDLQV